MQNSSSSFLKGLGAGMMVGAAAFTACKMMMNDRKDICKGSGKMVKAVGEFVDGVQTIFH